MKDMPVLRQIAWESVIIQVMLLAAFMGTAAYIGQPLRLAHLIGALLFLALQAVTKYVLERPISRGLRLVRKGQFEQAIAQFESAYSFYSRHNWADRFRFLLLISSRMAFREMVLVNLAVCHSQIGNGDKSKQYYQRALAEFPNSTLAQVALKAIQAYEANKE